MIIHDTRHDTEVNYGSIFNGPGAIGLIGEGYWWHKPWSLAGLTFKGLGRVYKTITADARPGNMELDKTTFRPVEWYPKCLKVYPRREAMMNAVGLSNPGVRAIMETGVYQKQSRPFMISFMATGKTREEILESARKFVRIMKSYLRHIPVPFVLQVNFGCPNTHVDPGMLYAEIEAILAILSELGVPMILNFNHFVPVEVLVKSEPYISGYWIANTTPWGSTDAIDWTRYEADGRSPLPLRLGDVEFWEMPEFQELQYKESQNKGGLSSPDCLPDVLEKTRQARKAGVRKPIIVGNGIRTVKHIRQACRAGASGVALVTVLMVAPRRTRALIREANRLEEGGYWNLQYEFRRQHQQQIMQPQH